MRPRALLALVSALALAGPAASEDAPPGSDRLVYERFDVEHVQPSEIVDQLRSIASEGVPGLLLEGDDPCGTITVIEREPVLEVMADLIRSLDVPPRCVRVAATTAEARGPLPGLSWTWSAGLGPNAPNGIAFAATPKASETEPETMQNPAVPSIHGWPVTATWQDLEAVAPHLDLQEVHERLSWDGERVRFESFLASGTWLLDPNATQREQERGVRWALSDLSLDVTPHVTPDDAVILELSIRHAFPRNDEEPPVGTVQILARPGQHQAVLGLCAHRPDAEGHCDRPVLLLLRPSFEDACAALDDAAPG